MKSKEPKGGGKGVGRLFSPFAAERKKGIAAVCLIGLMAFMWVRVLTKKTPETAEATQGPEMSTAMPSGQNTELQVSFVEMPKVEGRNDVLARDFFDAQGWQEFIGDGGGENVATIGDMNGVSENTSKELAKRIAKMLRLVAIGVREKPQAFINDQVLSEGDKLQVKDGTNTYEFEIVKIDENTVLMRYEDAEITLGLAQAVESSGK